MNLYIVFILLCVNVCISLPMNRLIKLVTGSDFEEVETSLITRGKTASRGQFPYHVGIKFVMGPSHSTFRCGASLISLNFVLTAAHCVYNDPSNGIWSIYLGAVNFDAEYEEGRDIYNVTRSNIKIHENFDYISQSNDIALIKLPHPVQETYSIQPISLPTRAESESPNSFIDETGTVTGWGRTSNIRGSLPKNLQWGEVRVINLSNCDVFQVYPVLDTQLCTNGSSTNLCPGDSGGPLVLSFPLNSSISGLQQEEPVLKQVAVYFAGAEKCQAGYPAVFTRIGPYLNWIGANSDAEIS